MTRERQSVVLAAVTVVLWFLSHVPASKDAAAASPQRLAKEKRWETYRGKAGPSGWRCHVIRPDPLDDGPDGVNLHDWDQDGDLDVFSNAEQGHYSRLFFNPGSDDVRELWPDYIEFKHGKCEDSGIGDLDNDGDVDYIANGGWIYFNPGAANVRDPAQWTKMTLFDNQRRTPIVTDVDGDGLNDLIVGAREWYKQPMEGKHNATNWTKYEIGGSRWPMNCIMYDVDKDGDKDVVVADRKIDTCWFVHPGRSRVTEPWERKTLFDKHEAMFMAIADVNGDGRDDFVCPGGKGGGLPTKLVVLLRTNDDGEPTFHEVVIDQPCGSSPKGVAVMELDGNPRNKEILIIPRQGHLWTATSSGDGTQTSDWTTTPLTMPGGETRTKMDNAWLGDIDGDGDLDVVTTEENGGWGVIWFENPEREGSSPPE